MKKIEQAFHSLWQVSLDMKSWKSEFHGAKIKFMSNFKNSYVVARSLIAGMGLDRVSQARKIKMNIWGWLITPPLVQAPPTLIIPRKNVQKYLNSICLTRLSPKKQGLVFKYQTEFYDFMLKETCQSADLKGIDEYIGSRDGVRQLVVDGIQRLGNKKAIEHVSDILWELISNENLSDHELIISNRVHTIAENIAKHRPKLGYGARG